MAGAEPEDLPVAGPTAPACRHLRSAGMYVHTDGSGGESRDDYRSAMYWCLKTMKGLGPDDDFVNAEECRNPSRSCYEPS
jgi:hypothetical protein